MPFVFKMKFGNTLRRMIVKEAQDGKPDLNYKDLEAKIRDMFHVFPDSRVVVTYIDQDNDIVTMGNELDLHDACIVQRIDPLRMEVKVIDIEPVGVNLKEAPPESESKSFLDIVKKPLDCFEKPTSCDIARGPLGGSKTAEEPLSKVQGALGSFQNGLHWDGCGFVHISEPLLKFRKNGHKLCLCSQCGDHQKVDKPVHSQRRHECYVPLKGKMARHPNNQLTTLKPHHSSKSKVCEHYCLQHKHFSCLNSNTKCHHSFKLLDSRFVRHLNFLKGGKFVVGRKFTKSWRLRNSGILPWPSATQLVYEGGDVLGCQKAYELEIPSHGLLSGAEIDVSVDLMVPDQPGRFVSYWRLMVPMGQKFGQKIWVIIQAMPKPEQLDQTSESSRVHSNKQGQVTEELSQSSCNNHEPSFIQSQKPIDVVEEHTQPAQEHVPSAQFSGSHIQSLTDRTCRDDADDFLLMAAIDEAASFSVRKGECQLMEHSMQSDADKHVTDASVVKSGVGSFSLIERPGEAFNVSGNKEQLLEDACMSMEPVHDEAAQTFEHYESNDCQEDIILGMLNSMGFTQRSLNLELLRKNKNDMQGIVDDLVVASEWDNILNALEGMK